MRDLVANVHSEPGDHRSPSVLLIGLDLGDAKAVVFWYKPKNSKTCRVIYGDLRIEDVPEEDLPETPKDPEESTATE